MTDNNGYYRMPTVSSEKVVFVSENDLWEVPVQGGIALRLTTSQGAISYPKFSPDGKWIAFSSTDEGSSDVYVMASSGGPITRLTYLGGDNRVRGWTLDGKFVIFSTSSKTPGISRAFYIYKVPVQGGEAIEIPVGVAQTIDYHKDGFAVIGRFQDDNATWKRYKGGRAGDIIVDNAGKGTFKPLISLPGNLVLPQFYKDHILFLSDHEGVSNLYSVEMDGSNLRKLSNQTDYYARFFSVFGDTAVYQAGGEIFSLNLSESQSKPQKLAISIPSMRMQRTRKFVEASEFLEDVKVARDFSHLVAIVRGKPFNFGFWEGGVTQLGKTQGVRYKLSVPLKDDSVAFFSDESGEYKLEIYSLTDYSKQESLDLDIGIPYVSQASPDGNFIALANHRFEIVLIDLVKKSSKVITKDNFRPIQHFSWSSDSKWLSYSLVIESYLSSIFLYNIVDDKEHQVTPTEFEDFGPVFDPKGRYLYFISAREFNSMYDNHYFKHVFPKGYRICAINLTNDLDPPFILKPKVLKKEEKNQKNKTDEEDAIPDLKIDLEGIKRRITMLPLEDNNYISIQASEDRLFYSTSPVLTNAERNGTNSKAPYTLKAFKLESLETLTIEEKISSFKLAEDYKTLLIKIDRQIKLLPFDFEKKGKEGSDGESNQNQTSRKTGFVDLKRIKALVEPEQEYKQMLYETWRLMRENYWEPTFHGLDWNSIIKKYELLVPKITTRDEFSDLVWEMIAETGTSHCYEMGGDYRKSPDFKLGYLGADCLYSESENGYVISHILKGDNWNIDLSSPLETPGTNINEGDIILSVNGLKGSSQTPIGELLSNLGGQLINLEIKNAKSQETRIVTVKALTSELELRYRDWVTYNRELVSTLSNNRLGYLHIPNMSDLGVTEFFRAFKKEIRKEGLIVDVRFNRGGNTSEIFLEILSTAQKRAGYDWTRHGKELSPYFQYTTEGPIVAVTNEFAGSDGDIFSHTFKFLKIGPLIGKRTWGGVVGIWPKVMLIDGSVVTQPEFSFWFKDVGWGVENYGTDPDVEVEFLPQDYANHVDPQLSKAVEIALEGLKDIKISKPTSPFK